MQKKHLKFWFLLNLINILYTISVGELLILLVSLKFGYLTGASQWQEAKSIQTGEPTDYITQNPKLAEERKKVLDETQIYGYDHTIKLDEIFYKLIVTIRKIVQVRKMIEKYISPDGKNFSLIQLTNLMIFTGPHYYKILLGTKRKYTKILETKT